MTKQYLMPASRITTGTAVPTSAGTAGDLYVRNTDPYPSGYIKIGTPAELVAFAARVNAGETSLNACLTADIDMDGVSFTPIGLYRNGYYGTFDGYGHTISNLTISNGGEYLGLVGYPQSGSVIKNVVCDSFDISGTISCGAISGYARPGSTIEKCYVYNSTIHVSHEQVGNCAGISGGGYQSTIRNCGVVGCDTSESRSISSIIGSAQECTISNCYAYDCTISGTAYVGGLIGSGSNCNVSYCAIYGGTHGNTLIGYNYENTINNCYTSSTSGMTEAIFKTRGFWDGTGISGTTYLSWDFDDTWEWDSTASLPKLKPVSVGTVETSMYAYNGSSWALQNTVLDSAPTSASANGVTSGGVYTALSAKQKSITVSTFEPTSSEGSDGDIWMVYTA